MILHTSYFMRVRWDDAEWANMHNRGGMIHEWTRENVAEAAAFARDSAPWRTGDLASTVRADNQRSGPLSLRSYLRAGGPRAPYAPFVIEGTTGPIRAKHHKYMNLRPGYGRDGNYYGPNYISPTTGKFLLLVREVSGQAPNNFLERASDNMIRRINAGTA